MLNPNHLSRNQELRTVSDLAHFFGGPDHEWMVTLIGLVATGGVVAQMRLAKGFPDVVWGWRVWQAEMPTMTVGTLEDTLAAMRKVWPGKHWEQ